MSQERHRLRLRSNIRAIPGVNQDLIIRHNFALDIPPRSNVMELGSFPGDSRLHLSWILSGRCVPVKHPRHPREKYHPYRHTATTFSVEKYLPYLLAVEKCGKTLTTVAENAVEKELPRGILALLLGLFEFSHLGQADRGRQTPSDGAQGVWRCWKK